MNDDELIMTISLLYVIVCFILHMIFFITRILNQNIRQKKISTDDSSLTSKAFHSYSFLLCTCLLISNWLRLGLLYLFPKIYPHLIESSLNICIIQSFFLHVLTYFHLHLTICLRLFWYYCFTFDKYWQIITYYRILWFILFIFSSLCLFTSPSINNEWTSIIFDKILHICIINYSSNYSYTFFVLIFNCLIPFLILIVCHKQHMKSIEERLSKYFSMDEKLNHSHHKNRFQYSSYLIIIWSFVNILLLIFLHVPIQHVQIRTIIYYIQIISFLFDPIFYIFIFRSLSIITLLKSPNRIYFI